MGSNSISNRPAQVLWKDDWNRTGRQNDKSAREHETGQGHKSKYYIPHLTLSSVINFPRKILKSWQRFIRAISKSLFIYTAKNKNTPLHSVCSKRYNKFYYSWLDVRTIQKALQHIFQIDIIRVLKQLIL